MPSRPGESGNVSLPQEEWGGGTGIIGIVLEDIILERKRQRELYPSSVSRSPAEWLAIVTGELGEVADEVLKMTVFDQANHDKYWEELVQVAACAIAALESMYLRKLAHKERMERRQGTHTPSCGRRDPHEAPRECALD